MFLGCVKWNDSQIVLWSLETVTFFQPTQPTNAPPPPPESLPRALTLPMLKWTAIQLYPNRVLASIIQRLPFKADDWRTSKLLSKGLSVDVLEAVHLPLMLDTCATQARVQTELDKPRCSIQNSHFNIKVDIKEHENRIHTWELLLNCILGAGIDHLALKWSSFWGPGS